MHMEMGAELYPPTTPGGAVSAYFAAAGLLPLAAGNGARRDGSWISAAPLDCALQHAGTFLLYAYSRNYSPPAAMLPCTPGARGTSQDARPSHIKVLCPFTRRDLLPGYPACSKEMTLERQQQA